MTTIYIPQPQGARAESLESLLNSLTELYPGKIETSEAIQVETEIPQVLALLKGLITPATGPACPDCGEPTHEGKTYCSVTCARRSSAKIARSKKTKKAAKLIEPDQPGNGSHLTDIDPITLQEPGVWREDPSQVGSVIEALGAQ